MPGRIGAQAIEETELVRFGRIRMNAGDPDRTIGSFGLFTVTAQCNLNGSVVQPTSAVSVTSSEARFTPHQ